MNYQYNGPVAGVHIADDVGDRVLIDGQRYELPETDASVQRLAALGFLTLGEPTVERSEKKESRNAR
ncbi:hypothetical protein ACPRNU_01115 [Chromobacterium vaccinii]|uniref:hypothetical protein n=1 Tax=Chromobacterium vaccinii TaxID=1108595 RepID=UPI003C722B4F